MCPTFIFILVSFVVGFICDVVLNDLSKHTKTFKSLQPYFNERYITQSAVNAGLTIGIATSVLLVIFKLISGSYLPYLTIKSIGMFLGIGYIIGYLIDVCIEKMNIFGNTLTPFYKEFGSGNSGALSFVFALILSLITCNYLIA